MLVFAGHGCLLKKASVQMMTKAVVVIPGGKLPLWGWPKSSNERGRAPGALVVAGESFQKILS